METDIILLIYAYQTMHDGRIYQLKLFCGQEYPDKPPSVRFQTLINMSGVNPETGMVGICFSILELHFMPLYVVTKLM